MVTLLRSTGARGWCPLAAVGFARSMLCGYGSKLHHQELDRRFWSMFSLTRVSIWGTDF